MFSFHCKYLAVAYWGLVTNITAQRKSLLSGAYHNQILLKIGFTMLLELRWFLIDFFMAITDLDIMRASDMDQYFFLF